MASLAELIRTAPKTPEKAGRAGKAQKSELDKLLEAFDKQAALFKAGKQPASAAHERRLWVRDLGDELSFVIRVGNTPLSLHEGKKVVYGDRKNANAILKLLRANLAAGEYNAEIDDILKARTAKRAAKKS